MNVLFSYKNPLIPELGGTERVARMVADILSSKGHSVYYLVTGECDLNALPVGHYAISQYSSLHERRLEVLAICRQLNIDVLINESGIDDDVYLFDAGKLQLDGVSLITCLHFDVRDDLTSFLRYFRFSFRGRSVKYALRHFIKCLLFPVLLLFDNLKKRNRYQYLLANSSIVVVPAPQIKNQLDRIFPKASINKVKVIPNPCAFSLKDIHLNTVTQKDNIFLYVGRLSEEKRVDKILDAWKIFSAEFLDWKLKIVGDGSLRQVLEDKVCKESIRSVQFIGRINSVHEEYANARYLLLASDSESFSLVLLESLCYGCYPIIFDFPAAQLVLPDPRWGSRLKRKTVQCMVSEMRRCIINGINNTNCRREIFSHLRKFEVQEVGEKWGKIVSSL